MSEQPLSNSVQRENPYHVHHDFICPQRLSVKFTGTTSFPVPFSPVINTLASVFATFATISRTSRNEADSPIMTVPPFTAVFRFRSFSLSTSPPCGVPEPDGSLYGCQQFTVLPRFQYKIKCTFLHRAYSQFNIPEGGNHNNRMIRIIFQNTFQPIQTFIPRVDTR